MREQYIIVVNNWNQGFSRGKHFVAGRNFRILNGIKCMGKGTTEDEMAGWHHQFNGHEFE